MKIKRPRNWTEQRLTLLAEIRNSRADKDWSVRELADEMQKHELVRRFQPAYSKSSVHRDLSLINNQLASKREELAEEYIHTQLDILDDAVENLVADLERLEMMKDSYEEEFRDAEAYYKTKVNLYKTLLLVQRRQASILPIDAPKKLMLESSHKIDIEHFYQIAERANVLQLDDPTIIDGDFYQA